MSFTGTSDRSSRTITGTAVDFASGRDLFLKRTVSAPPWSMFGITGDFGITGASQIANAGTLKKTGGSGTSTITGSLDNAGGGLFEVARGTLAIRGSVLKSGTVEATSGGTVDLEGAVGGRGTLDVEANSILELGAMIGAAQTATLGSDGDTLQLDAPATYKGTVAGFGGNDTIDVGGFNEFTSILFKANAGDTGGTLTLLADANHSMALHLSIQCTTNNITDSSGGALSVDDRGLVGGHRGAVRGARTLGSDSPGQTGRGSIVRPPLRSRTRPRRRSRGCAGARPQGPGRAPSAPGRRPHRA